MTVADWFQWLNAAYGINLSVFYDPFDRSRFLRGLGMTIYLSVACIFLSLIIGLIGAWFQGARSRLVRSLTWIYVETFRNTPPLVQLMFFYFALGATLPSLAGVAAHAPLIGNVGWAVISFSLFAGAFNVEIFRSGIEAVPSATREAAESLGYTRFQIYRYVVVPLAFRICLPALNNNLVNLMKTTTLAYAIGVPELLYASAQVWSEVFNVREMMLLLLVCFVLMVGAFVTLMSRIERALHIPGYSV